MRWSHFAWDSPPNACTFILARTFDPFPVIAELDGHRHFDNIFSRSLLLYLVEFVFVAATDRELSHGTDGKSNFAFWAKLPEDAKLT
jgi:hypothetical protein